jgi:hypothetical protein
MSDNHKITNPNYSDDSAPESASPKQKLSRGQQKRADYKRRLLRQAAKQTELAILLGLPILRMISKQDLNPGVIEIRDPEGNATGLK